MRRYIPTLLVIFGLLALGALAIVATQSGGAGAASSPMLFIIGGVVAAAVVVVLIGYLFGLLVTGLAGALSDEKPVKTPPPAVAAPAVAPAPKKAPAAAVPLSDGGSVGMFFGLAGAVVFVFLTLRAVAAGMLPGFPLDRALEWNASVFGLPAPFNLGLVLALAGAVFVVGALVVGAVLAKVFAAAGRATLKLEAAAKAKAAAEAPAAKPKAAPAAKPAAGEAPKVFLSDTRSQLIFFGVALLIVAVFLTLRTLASGSALGFTPFDRILEVVVFSLPDKGGDISALVVGLGFTVFALVSVAAAGVGLARLIAQFTAAEQTLAKAPPAWPAKELTDLEARLKSGALRPPARLSGLDQFILLIFVVMAVLLLAWVLPGLGLIGNTDTAVSATQIAASWTPTPKPGPVVTVADLLAKLPKGDPQAGEAAVKKYGCVACHVGADADAASKLAGPAWLAAQSKDGKGIADHAAARWQDANYTGKAKSAAEYLYESLVNPAAYVVAGFQPAMPPNFGTLVSDQEKADIIAYLTTLK